MASLTPVARRLDLLGYIYVPCGNSDGQTSSEIDGMPQTSKPTRQAQPRVKSGGAKSPTIAFRVRGDLYERLKASAEARGFSLSEEIEHRLNRSMDTASDHFAELALQLIADNWRAVQSLSGRRMVEDKFTLQACCEAAYRATELLAGVNGMELKVGALDSLGAEGVNVEAGKQLGQAIVYHRELLHMKNPPEWATGVYESNVIDALTKRVSYLQARVGEHPAPVEEPATRLTGQPEATRLMASVKPARGQNSSVFDEALFAETMGPKRPDDGDDTPPASTPVPAPAKRSRKAKAST